MDTSQFGKYLTDEQKAGQYDALLQAYFDLKTKYEQMQELMYDWALIQSRVENFARSYRAPLKKEGE